MQQDLFYKLVGTVAYVGSQGRNLFLRGLSNTLRAGNATILDGAALPTNAGVINRIDATGRVIGVTSVRVFDIINNAGACGLAASAVPICRPFAEIDTKTSGGSDSYNALQVTLARRFSSGLTLNAQYAFSRSFGNTSGSNEARTAAEPFGGTNGSSKDTNNYAADEGFNNFDVRQTFNLSAVYDLPIGKGRKFDFSGAGNLFFGGWEVGAILNARSGVPIDVTLTRPEVVIQCTNAAAGCAAGEVRGLPGTINATNPLPAGFTAVINAPGGGASRQTRRPDLIPGVNPFLDSDRNFLNPAAFAIPKVGAFGNLPRNAFKGPDFKQFDNRPLYHLGRKQMEVLFCLARAGGRPVARFKVWADVWRNEEYKAQTLRICIAKLRRKLEPYGLIIISPVSSDHCLARAVSDQQKDAE